MPRNTSLSISKVLRQTECLGRSRPSLSFSEPQGHVEIDAGKRRSAGERSHQNQQVNLPASGEKVEVRLSEVARQCAGRRSLHDASGLSINQQRIRTHPSNGLIDRTLPPPVSPGNRKVTALGYRSRWSRASCLRRNALAHPIWAAMDGRLPTLPRYRIIRYRGNWGQAQRIAVRRHGRNLGSAGPGRHRGR